MFPLAILPLPGELVPLHIFEPRYRELLLDAETKDIGFGIYFNHDINVEQVGSLMKLESIIKRYPGGESDIVVKCEKNFNLDKLLRNYKNKLYPGGDVHYWNTDLTAFPSQSMYDMFIEYLRLRNFVHHPEPFSLYQIALALNLDLNDRYKFLITPEDHQETFLVNRIKFQIHLLQQEDRSKDVSHLN